MAELVIHRGLEEPDSAAAFVSHKAARPEKAEGNPFKLVSEYEPAGDQADSMSACDPKRTSSQLGEWPPFPGATERGWSGAIAQVRS